VVHHWMYPLHVHIPPRPHCCWMSSDRLPQLWEIKKN